MNGQRKIRVAVVFGGRSTEHGVSALSAASVLEHLASNPAFEVVPIGINRRGQWLLTSGDPEQLRLTGREMPEVSTGTEVVLPADATTRAFLAVRPDEGVAALSGVDVVFPVLHGAYGEDGTIQGLLEMADIPYVGAGVLASAVAMDKEYAKKLLAAEGLRSGPYAVLRPHDKTLSEADRDRLGLPVFVKPARGGSSIGISRVSDWAELETAIATARQVDPKVLIEAAVVGREMECAVLEGEDGGRPEASLPSEIRVIGSRQGWYDYETKYLDDATEFDIPPDVPAEVIDRIQDMACRAFAALDGAGLARVDFFYTDDGELLVNEVNTMPGFTSISQYPAMWAATGLPYPELLARLVRAALRRGTGLR
ncbi:D-alanine--D-alanine ligase family protein [Fodinicola acaciae]|uniref:D-alanine--D-alanine ligase family protein n=1 Tax=Fodinicola acaciae TaxID=2681555 RepID=UPI0013D4ADB7|nr:D-alanine--D-alanine ligase family protein [Fodinicola acaciae]